jgi:hypothetical protein
MRPKAKRADSDVLSESPVKLYSYVVQHDAGRAPNPYFGVCTLCRCKYRKCSAKPKNVIELAQVGDWVVGTGGADLRKSAGHGKLVYAMRVDEKLTRETYYACPRFAAKRSRKTGTYQQTQGDSERPKSGFEKREQYALISRHFYYFGASAIDIPKEAPRKLEKRGPGFRSGFAPAEIRRFVEWLEKKKKPGKYGEPRMRPEEPKGSKICKSSC